ncbi:nucleotidyltransferase family protein [Dyadobacter sp. CY261]|uniref:nucleotidyltransferase family protein n=1 Tax=Dyadobacter sp. CY261 TaxID=2907203 RepID=UPI001F2674F3|nr:nucleotidyltransferase family protein [Dyadobacter sp. CY261]MCF0073167.1 nucleotidyltransferase family protein [Dyadobacter sp. CY261]
MVKTSSTELSLILDACLGSQNDHRTEVVNTGKLYDLARYHQVRPQLLSYLNERESMPEIQAILREDCQQIAFSNMVAAKELVDVSNLLKEHGVDSFAYKGSFWADWLYGNVSQREFGDIDVLIPEFSFTKAYELLMTQGGYVTDEYRLYLLRNPKTRKRFFRTDYHIPMINHPDKSVQSVVEAHWRIAYPRLAFDFPSDEWAKYKEEYAFLGSDISSFQREYQLLLLLVHHGGKEEWRKLKYVADFAAYMRRFGSMTNWNTVAEIAKQKGIFSLFIQSVGLLRVLGMEWKEEWPVFETTLLPHSYLRNWEKRMKEPSNSTWPYFKHGLSIHDGIKHKTRLILGHFKYLTEFQLIWSKFRYKQRLAKLGTRQ